VPGARRQASAGEGTRRRGSIMSPSAGGLFPGKRCTVRFRGMILAVFLVLGSTAFTPAVLAQSNPPPAAPSPSQDGPKPSDTAKPADASPSQDQKPADAAPDQAVADQPQESPGTSTQPASEGSYKHDGGKNDVDAIGNRKMGGRGLGNWYSLEKEIRMGKEYA